MALRNTLRGVARRFLQPTRARDQQANLARSAQRHHHRQSQSQGQGGGGTLSRRGWAWWRTWVRAALLREQSLPESVDTLFGLLRRQLHVYASQKLRRMEGVLSLYGVLYAENVLQTMASNFSRRFVRAGRKRPFYVLFGGACFVWDRDNRISDDEMDRCSDDFGFVAELEAEESSEVVPQKARFASWDTVFKDDHLKIWRRPLDDSYLYEYKAFGRFMNISAKSFLHVQLDLGYRKVWDKYAIRLDVVDRDDETGSEVIHWVTHYPFPMYSRDYVFARRFKVDHASNTMMLVSKAVEHPRVPVSNSHVRVSTYFSQMVIRPHRGFDENGFDFILTYHDDPQTSFPSPCVNWMTKSGLPEFLEQLHQAAMDYDSYNTPPALVRDLSSNSNPKHYGQQSPSQYSL